MAVTKGGSPDDAQRVDVPEPEAGPGEVLVDVVCSAVNPADLKVIDGGFTGRLLHASTSPLVIGYDVSGTVVSVGSGVTDLEPGDAVWGHLPYSGSNAQGAFAERVTLPRDQLARLPDGVGHHEAAAAATVGLTALQSLRDKAGIGEGKRVLVIGAAGGVGSLAVGIGKRLGAEVVGVCSTPDVDRVKELGADRVIDRKKDDALADDARYHMVFDTPAVHSYGACVGVLEPDGAYVTTLPSPGLVVGMLRTLFSSRSCSFIAVASVRADLERLGEWLADGLQVPIDSRVPVGELSTALRRMTEKGRRGRVVVDVADGW